MAETVERAERRRLSEDAVVPLMTRDVTGFPNRRDSKKEKRKSSRLRSSESHVYDGDKNTDQIRQGVGSYLFTDEFYLYEGQYVDGRKHGHGRFSMRDGSYFEGEFYKGEITGYGMKYFSMTGNKYVGDFVEGEMHGNGLMTYADGSTYDGEWKDNKRTGNGVHRLSDGCVYDGCHLDNLKHGHGRMSYKGRRGSRDGDGDEDGDGDGRGGRDGRGGGYGDPECYEGDWVHGKQQGHGRMTCRDGLMYEGQFMNDRYHGFGRLSNACTGAWFEGQWRNGEVLDPPFRLYIVGATCEPYLVLPGEGITIIVESLTEDFYPTGEHGRDVKLSAGIRYNPQLPTPSSGESTEEVTPFPTPFGFDYVPYPLSDLYKMRDGENMAEDRLTIRRSECTARTSSTEESSALWGMCVEPYKAEPPPVKSSIAGGVTFDCIVLPSPSPTFRPNLPRIGTTQMVSDPQPSVASVTGGRTTPERRDSSAGQLRARSASRVRAVAAYAEERFAKLGDYVIIAEDVTENPLFCAKLEPAFIYIQVVRTKPQKTQEEGEEEVVVASLVAST